MFNLALTAEIAALIAVFYLCGCVLGFAARWVVLRPPRTETVRKATPHPIVTGPEPAPASADPALLDGPVDPLPAEALEPSAQTEPPTAPQMEVADDRGRPPALAEPHGGIPDDLKQIKGIGPKLESTLHDLGIYHLSQIAGWSEADAAWVSSRIGFAGRVEREGWVTQAKAITAKQQTP